MQKENNVYLFENFYISKKKNTIFQVSLTDKGIVLKKESSATTKEQNIALKYIIGSKVLRRSRSNKNCNENQSSCKSNNLSVVEDSSDHLDEKDVSAYLYIYAYPLKNSRKCHERTTITLRFRSYDKYDDNKNEAKKWYHTIRALLNDEKNVLQSIYVPKETRKVLVIVNPKSGQGKARELFQSRVCPIFQEAEIGYELHITKNANFAREFVRNRDIRSWRSIVVLGGDGIFFEIINGIFEREDWQQIIDEVKIGIIPCGSGNGLARSISYSCGELCNTKPILSAVLAVVKEKTTFMDLVRVETCNNTLFSFLSVGWGLIADIDIESERLRSIGQTRFTVWSIHRLISLRTYVGKVSYLPVLVTTNQRKPSHTITSGIPLKHSTSHNTTLNCQICHGHGECEICDIEFGDVLSLETVNEKDSVRPRFDSWYSTTSRKSAYFSTRESIYQSTGERESLHENLPHSIRMFGPSSRLPALTTGLPNTNWIHLPEKEFVMVHAAYQTHLGYDCFFAPKSKLNDGIIWLIVIKGGVSRISLLNFLLGLSNGNHIPTTNNEFIQMIPCTAFRIEPDRTSGNGNITIDGEKIEYGPVQGEIFPGIARIMIPNNN